MRNGGKGLRICIDSMNTSLFSKRREYIEGAVIGGGG